jgi:hypothetical protein
MRSSGLTINVHYAPRPRGCRSITAAISALGSKPLMISWSCARTVTGAIISDCACRLFGRRTMNRCRHASFRRARSAGFEMHDGDSL